jgi:hypothetical protein
MILFYLIFREMNMPSRFRISLIVSHCLLQSNIVQTSFEWNRDYTSINTPNRSSYLFAAKRNDIVGSPLSSYSKNRIQYSTRFHLFCSSYETLCDFRVHIREDNHRSTYDENRSSWSIRPNKSSFVASFIMAYGSMASWTL